MEEEREANLLAPPSPTKDHPNAPLTTDTQTSSSTSPNFARQVQAAFKRHKPIGIMQGRSFQAKRVFLPQRVPVRANTGDSISGFSVDTEKSQDLSSKRAVAADELIEQRNPDDSSTSPPLVSETATKTDGMVDRKDSNVVPQQMSALDGQKKVQFCLGGDESDKRADEGIATGTDYLSSHMSYLALTEMEFETSNSKQHDFQHTEMSDISSRGDGGISSLLAKRNMLMQDQQHQFSAFVGKGINHPMTHSSVVDSSCATTTSVHSRSALMLNSTTYSSNTCRDTSSQMDIEQVEEFNVKHQPIAPVTNEVRHAMTQSSVMDSSCVTTISVHSRSAPMLSSTTYSSRSCLDGSSHMETDPVEEVKANPQPIDAVYSAQPSCPTLQPSGILGDPTAAQTHTLNSALDTEGVRDNRLTKGQQSCEPREIDGLRDGLVGLTKSSSNVENKSTKDKGLSGDITDIQSQAPVTKGLNSNTKTEVSKSDKPGKSASSKSDPRRKGNDSDLFFKVNGKRYQKLGKIGSGGSSEVHKVISSDCSIYALKKIELKGRDYSTAYGFCQEIEYLNKLKGKTNIIQLKDYEVTDKVLLKEVLNGSMSIKDGRIRNDGYIYMVLEYGEIDLAHMLSQKWKEMDSSNWNMDENWLRFYWQQILQAVNTIHEERIVHSDLKPANFLLVKGALKLIDFGIAKAILSDTTNIQRDSQVGTLSYMSPEAFMCNETDADGNAIKCGRPSDIWSLGCILYQMVYGRTPFSEYKTFWAKFKVITDRNHEITYEPVSNPWLLDLMKKCLAWDRNERWRIPQLLQHPFLVPPIPSPLSSPEDQSFKLLQQIAEVHKNDRDAFRLCSQIQQLLTEPTLVTSRFSTSRDQHCGLLSQISRLCLQLQQQLASSGEEVP